MASPQEGERYYFERFKRLYPLPEGAIQYTDKPDIIIKSDKILGIEITNFYLNDGRYLESEQRQNPIRERVTKFAQRIYQKNNGRNIELWFGFNFITNENGLAKKIAQFAFELKQQESGVVPPMSFSNIPELSYVYFNAQEYQDPQWRVLQTYSSSMMDVDRLLEIIHEKEEKAKSYQPCDAYWLLIVIDFINRAQDQEITNVDIPKIRSSVFEKILIYKTGYENVLEVI